MGISFYTTGERDTKELAQESHSMNKKNKTTLENNDLWKKGSESRIAEIYNLKCAVLNNNNNKRI